MRFVLITGMSGGGKSQVVRYLEDMDYYCIDNMPPSLIIKFAELCFNAHEPFDKVAICCDIRGGEMFFEFLDTLKELDKLAYTYELLFIDAKDEILVSRYKETRRKHPLHPNKLLSESIADERDILSDVKPKANYIIDTSSLSLSALRTELSGIFGDKHAHVAFMVNVLSFGFKFGLPLDADLVFDVRFLPNPFYIPELKQHTGKDESVYDYVFSHNQTKIFTKKLFDMIDFLIPYYIDEGKSQLVIAIGCTGGKHRSVAISESLKAHLSKGSVAVTVNHRDIKKHQAIHVN